MELTLSETGLIGLVGMVLGFALSCCRQIEQSRCEHINCFGVKCDRKPLSDETVLAMDNENKTNDIEMPNRTMGNL